jgi:chemotaxis protein histidine kinase CheA/ActR/RegA family two-component response regulator
MSEPQFDTSAMMGGFINEVGDFLNQIGGALDHLAQQPDDKDALREAFRCAHTIHGSAAMMGFAPLSEQARALEDLFSVAQQSNGGLNEPMRVSAQQGLQQMSEMLAGIQTGHTGSQAAAGPGPQSKVPEWLAAFGDMTSSSGRMPIVQPGVLGGPSAPNPAPGHDESTAKLPMTMPAAGGDALSSQVSRLRGVVQHMRDASQTVDRERGELQSFLDGAPDAMQRLEAWAGQQMGLDLASSPDSVRRYLALSVVWVTVARLKRIAALLNSTGVEAGESTAELERTLGEVRATMAAMGPLAVAAATSPNSSVTATVAQVRVGPEALSPADRAAIEAEVRVELRRELEPVVRQEVIAQAQRDVAARVTATSAPMVPVASKGRPMAVTGDLSPEAAEVFREEAGEHLQTITEGIAKLERTPNDMGTIKLMRRAMHTLKGAAGMMGQGAVETIAHSSEDLLDLIADGKTPLTPDMLTLFTATCEGLDALVRERVGNSAEVEKLVRSLTEGYSRVVSGGAANSAVRAARGSTVVPAATGASKSDPGDESALYVRLQLSKLDELVTLFGDILVNRSIVEDRFRRISSLATETGQVGERLREVGGQLEGKLETAALPSGRMSGLPDLNGAPGVGRYRQPQQPAHANEFDELELDRYNELHLLSRGLGEAVADIVTLNHDLDAAMREVQTAFEREGRVSTTFQERLLKARLVSLRSLVPRLYRAVRQAAEAEGKEVELFVEGADTEVDRKVIEDMEAPLMHLVRNAVVHGIEKPGDRDKKRKPHKGSVTLAATYEGNQVAISIRDDGAGIDPEKIKAAAISRGVVAPDKHLSDRDAVNLLFHQGMSTAEVLTERGGRGVGLDVVAGAAAKLHGSVEVDWEKGRGTVFTMRFPMSLQIARAVLVRVGTQLAAIPMGAVERIARLEQKTWSGGESPSVQLNNERVPVVHLASYLHVNPAPLGARTPVLFIMVGGKRRALLVDSIASQQEVVLKPLGSHLRDVPGVSGAAVMGNGQVVVILDPGELLSRVPQHPVALGEPVWQVTAGPMPTQQPTVPLGSPALSNQPTLQLPDMPMGTVSPGSGVFPGAGVPQGSGVFSASQVVRSYVLVVDDSRSVRQVVSNELKASGWETQEARDGLEALEVATARMPAAILLDIEMPRMDGYELISAIRGNPRFAHLPLIVLTTRAAKKHSQRAFQLGADDYIVKPYPRQELLEKIDRLVRARAGQG